MAVVSLAKLDCWFAELRVVCGFWMMDDSYDVMLLMLYFLLLFTFISLLALSLSLSLSFFLSPTVETGGGGGGGRKESVCSRKRKLHVE